MAMISAFGPGLSHGVVNQQVEFTVKTKNVLAAAGGFSLGVEGPSKAEVKCKDHGDGTCTVTYLPTSPGEYRISVMFDDMDIIGSPFKAQIVESFDQVVHSGLSDLSATMTSPSGKNVSCDLKRLPNGHLDVSFLPTETGNHTVSIKHKSTRKLTDCSPFTKTVYGGELGDASKVKVSGLGLEHAAAKEENIFHIDTRGAGYAILNICIEGPSKPNIDCQELGGIKVTYKPSEPGDYTISITYGGQHTPGSPYKVKVGGGTPPEGSRKPEKESAEIMCELSFEMPDYGIPKEVLARCPSEDDLSKLSLYIGKEIVDIASALGISKSKVDQIQLDNPDKRKIQIFHLLKDWESLQGEAATIKSLLEAFRKCNANIGLIAEIFEV